jgi:ubiquinone/menaquinone biosynthesis C-methylase UbiE
MKNKQGHSFELKYRKDGLYSQRRYPNEQLIQFLARNYFRIPPSLKKKTKILELGAGSCANLWMIAKEGLEAYGIDTSPTGIKIGKKALNSWGVKAHISLGDMRRLDFPDGFFDCIVDIVSMQHVNLREHKKSYAEIYRCLKSGGRLFQFHLSDKSSSYTTSRDKKVDALTVENISNKRMPLNNNGVTCFLNPHTALDYLRHAGFSEISIELYRRTYERRTQSVEYLVIDAIKPLKVDN